jgi:hypothetical protein
MNLANFHLRRLSLIHGMRWAIVVAMLWATRLSAAQTATNAPVTRDFNTFKIIVERNIFNPNRRPGQRPGDRGEAPKPVKTDGLSLVGTLVYDTNAYAFFDGSDARFRTVLQTSNSLSGLTLVEITPDRVKFNTASNTLELPIGMQLKRQEEGPWLLVAEAGSWAPTSDSSAAGDRPPGERPGGGGSSGGNSSSASSNSGGGGSDEVLKRLMQKREQELSK